MMADEIGADVVARDRRGFLGRCAGGLQQRVGDLDQAISWNVRHGVLPARLPKARRSGRALSTPAETA
jgi:hypothetical protein